MLAKLILFFLMLSSIKCQSEDFFDEDYLFFGANQTTEQVDDIYINTSTSPYLVEEFIVPLTSLTDSIKFLTIGIDMLEWIEAEEYIEHWFMNQAGDDAQIMFFIRNVSNLQSTPAKIFRMQDLVDQGKIKFIVWDEREVVDQVKGFSEFFKMVSNKTHYYLHASRNIVPKQNYPNYLSLINSTINQNEAAQIKWTLMDFFAEGSGLDGKLLSSANLLQLSTNMTYEQDEPLISFNEYIENFLAAQTCGEGETCETIQQAENFLEYRPI